MTTTHGRRRSLMFLRFPARLSHYGGHGQRCLVSSSRPSNRACGSPAHGLPTFFTEGIQRFQARKGLGGTTIPSRLIRPR